MTEENIDIEKLKERGLSCGKLKNMELNKLNDAKLFRSVGFINLANGEDASADKIKSLRKKVCLLK